MGKVKTRYFRIYGSSDIRRVTGRKRAFRTYSYYAGKQTRIRRKHLPVYLDKWVVSDTFKVDGVTVEILKNPVSWRDGLVVNKAMQYALEYLIFGPKTQKSVAGVDSQPRLLRVNRLRLS